MSVTNYYGNLIVESGDDELYIRCFNHICEPLRDCLQSRKAAKIECFLGDVNETGINEYDTLIVDFEPQFKMSMSNEVVILGEDIKEHIITELLKYLCD